MVKVFGAYGRWKQGDSSVYGGVFLGCFAAVISITDTANGVNSLIIKQAKERNMEIDYIPVGDYLLPAVKLSDPPDAPPLGLYGELHKRYLQEHRPILYSQLLLSEKLYPVCREIDSAAQSRLKCGMAHGDIVRELVCY